LGGLLLTHVFNSNFGIWLQFQPIVSSTDKVEQIHRIVLYKCVVPSTYGRNAPFQLFDKYVNRTAKVCFSPESPRDWRLYCSSTILISWTKGSLGK